MSDVTRIKTCTKCKVDLPLSSFGKDTQKRDGLTPRCNPCRREDRLVYAKSDVGKAKQREASSRYMRSEHGRRKRQQWHAERPDRERLYKATYRAKNPDADRLYYEANREAALERWRKRRALKLSATVGEIDLDQVWADSDGFCQICGAEIDFDAKHPDPLSKSVDHIVPLSKGGTHEQANLQAAHLVCNIKKGAKVPVTEQAV